MKVRYDIYAVRAAAYYISTYLPKVFEDFEQAHDAILDTIKSYAADREVTFVESGGYYVAFDRVGSLIEVDIFVDPKLVHGGKEELVDYEL